jgi:hypothetical protein
VTVEEADDVFVWDELVVIELLVVSVMFVVGVVSVHVVCVEPVKVRVEAALVVVVVSEVVMIGVV